MNTTPSPDDNPESRLLQLLASVQSELAEALNSLAGRIPTTICDPYFANAGSYINRAVEGYLVLRTTGRIDSLKLLVRSTIEAMIRIQALRRHPDLLYRIAYSEALEDKKWFRPAVASAGIEYDDKADPPGWERFEAAYRTEFPEEQPKRERLSLAAAAKFGGLEEYYDTHYRMYCGYAHAALRATGGHLDGISDPEDTRTMICCAFAALDAAAAIGGKAPQLARLRVQVDELSKQPPLAIARKR